MSFLNAVVGIIKSNPTLTPVQVAAKVVPEIGGSFGWAIKTVYTIEELKSKLESDIITSPAKSDDQRAQEYGMSVDTIRSLKELVQENSHNTTVCGSNNYNWVCEHEKTPWWEFGDGIAWVRCYGHSYCTQEIHDGFIHRTVVVSSNVIVGKWTTHSCHTVAMQYDMQGATCVYDSSIGQYVLTKVIEDAEEIARIAKGKEAEEKAAEAVAKAKAETEAKAEKEGFDSLDTFETKNLDNPCSIAQKELVGTTEEQQDDFVLS